MNSKTSNQNHFSLSLCRQIHLICSLDQADCHRFPTTVINLLPPLTFTPRLSAVPLHTPSQPLCREWAPYTEHNPHPSSSLLILPKHPASTPGRGAQHPTEFPWLCSNTALCCTGALHSSRPLHLHNVPSKWGHQGLPAPFSSISTDSLFIFDYAHLPGTFGVLKAFLTLMALQLYHALQASLLERAANVFALDRSILPLSIWSHLYSLAYYHNFSTNWTLLRRNMFDYKRNWSGSCSLEITFQALLYNSQKISFGGSFSKQKAEYIFYSK